MGLYACNNILGRYASVTVMGTQGERDEWRAATMLFVALALIGLLAVVPSFVQQRISGAAADTSTRNFCIPLGLFTKAVAARSLGIHAGRVFLSSYLPCSAGDGQVPLEWMILVGWGQAVRLWLLAYGVP